MAGQNMVEHKLRLLLETSLDDDSKQKVGKQLKSILEGAAIGFDEAETKRNLEPIIRMIQKLFDKAEMKFDADKLLGMPSQKALKSVADITADEFQAAFDRALAKSGGVKIDFGNVDLSNMTEPLERVVEELSEISRKIADETKKSVDDIEKRLKKISTIEKTAAAIDKTLSAVNNQRNYRSEQKAIDALEKARGTYEASVENGDPWEIQYQHLISFVSKYEAMTKKIKPLIDTEHPEFKALYDILSPKAGAAKISLEHFVDVARGNELTEYKNQPWARESTLKKIEQTLRSGISVKDGSSVGDDSDKGDTGNDVQPWDNGEDKEPKKPLTKVPIVEEPEVDVSPKDVEVVTQVVLTKTEELILAAIEEAKSRLSSSWSVANSNSKAEALKDALWSRFALTSGDKDDADYLTTEALAYSSGSDYGDLSELAAEFDQKTRSIEAMYDQATEEVKQIVQKLALIDDINGAEAFELTEELSEKDADLSDLILDYEDVWTKFREKLLSPASTVASDGGVEQTTEPLVEQLTLLEKIQKLTTYIDDNYLSVGKHLSDFLDDLQSESVELDAELKAILTTLRLIDDSGKFTFDVKRNGEGGGGTTHKGALISDDFVIIERGDYEKVKDSRMPDNTQRAKEGGISVAEILGYLPSKHTGGFFDVQGAARGHNLFENGVLSQDVVDATDEQLEQLVQAFIKARDYGFDIENGGSNIVYDKERGFSFYDLEDYSGEDAEFWSKLDDDRKKLMAIENLFSLFSGLNRDHSNTEFDPNVENFTERIKSVIKRKGIVSPSAVDERDRNYEDIYDDVFSGDLDAEYEDIAARLQEEEEAHRQNAAAIREEKQAQEEANQSFLDGVLAAARAKAGLSDASTEVAAEFGEHVASDSTIPTSGTIDVTASIDLEELRSLLDSVTYKVQVVGDTDSTDDNKVSINTDELKSVLDGITYNVKIAHDDTDKDSNKISIDEGTLETVLKRITYDVKIAHDDSDKEANKIAIDESALESTLNRVFANVLNHDNESKEEPWALEKTLNTTIKGVLDKIQANTAKTEAVDLAPVSVGSDSVLATESTLSAIKTAVEAINSKVVKGAKTKSSGGAKAGVATKNAESYAGSQYFPEKIKTQTMYLAKFRAQLMATGKLTDDIDARIYELLDGLKQVQNGPDLSRWNQQFLQLKTSIGIVDIFDGVEDKEVADFYDRLIEFQKERNKLELQYERAQEGTPLKQFYAEQLAHMDSVIAQQEVMIENEEYEARLAKIRAEQERKLGEVEAKAATKAAKKDAAAAKRLAQREAMLGKAGSAVGRAETTWMSAVGIDGLPTSFVSDIDKYYQKLDALRKKHQELKNSDMISEEQRQELFEQMRSVNMMTEAIGELVSEYQKLSGDNITVIGSNSLGADAGLKAYEQQLRQTVMTATNGKAQIKGFDAATKTLTYTVKTGQHEFTEYTAAVRRADGALVSVQGATKRTETFMEATMRKMKEISSYMSGMSVISRLGQELRRGIQYVREIDLALTELRKVTDETEEEYDQFLKTAAKTGARLGTTISAVTEATSTFAKLGYEMSQATEMAEAAIVYKNVGDNIESTEDAADSIISTMKGFGMEASEAMAIVDRFNEVKFLPPYTVMYMTKMAISEKF